MLFSYIYFLNFTLTLTDLTSFFSLYVAVFFTLFVKHGHIAPDYRLQTHTHVFPTETHQHRGSEGRGGERSLWKHLLMSESWSLPLIPKLVQLDFFYLSYLFINFFLAKENLSNQRNQICVFRQDARKDGAVGFNRPVLLCGDPPPELTPDIPPTHRHRVPTQCCKQQQNIAN